MHISVPMNLSDSALTNRILLGTEESNIEKKEQLQMIIDSFDAGIWDWNVTNNTVWWSEKLYSLLGRTIGEIEASFEYAFSTLVHPADRKNAQQSVELHLQTGKPYYVEMRVLHKNGNYYWFETTGKAKFGADGKPLRMVGCLRKIEYRKKLQIELEKAKFLLNETGRMAKVGGWEIDLLTGKRHWSKEILEILELEDIKMPSTFSILRNFSTESRSQLANAIDVLKKSGKRYELDLEFKTAGGKLIWVRSIGEAVKDSKDNIIAIRGIFQDINNLKRKELELQSSSKLILDQNNRLINFAHIVSHNLNSHSGNISMLLELLEAETSEEKRKEVLQYLKNTSVALQDTIHNLNEVVSIQTDTSKAKELLSFEKIYDQVIDVLSAKILETGTLIDADFSACKMIEYVPAYLESIMLNLVSNAIKYRHTDRAPLIEIKTSTEDGRPVLSVSDNGTGIDLALHGDKLFRMYKTFHGNPDARGIGLFITKNQVESLGGNISVQSSVNVGTTFKIKF